MISFIKEIHSRDEPLFYFGSICLLIAAICMVLSGIMNIQINNTNAWYKPFKFAMSIAIYCFTMSWFCHYLTHFNQTLFSWTIILLLGFEIAYIFLQASRGQQSHFNISTPVYTFLYSLMAIAASGVALYTAYINILFFSQSFPQLPQYYVWAIRLGMVLFVVFSFEGFVMGSQLSHTIGGTDGGKGLPILNWSTTLGDPRVAHFIGMHALQILPLLSFYILKNTKLTFVVAILYAALAIYTLIQALQAKPFIKIS
jgi:hypothetical protein